MTLADMLAKMREHAANCDLEVAHSEADDLLEAALRLLAAQLGLVKEVDDLLEVYESFEKWYA